MFATVPVLLRVWICPPGKAKPSGTLGEAGTGKAPPAMSEPTASESRQRWAGMPVLSPPPATSPSPEIASAAPEPVWL